MLPEKLGGAWCGRIEREAAITDDQRRHTLYRLLDPLRFPQADQVIVAVRVDEAGRQVASLGLDDLRSLGRK